MRDDYTRDDPAVSPTQARIDFMTVNRELLGGTLRALMHYLPRCERHKECDNVALYRGSQKPDRPMGMFRKIGVCAEHATDLEKYNAIEGADYIAVAAQLLKECGE